MANRFIEFLESMTIALEADDITGQVTNDVKNAIGGTPSTSDNDDIKEDLGKVDDIFGTETPDNAENEDSKNNQDENQTNEENPENTEEIPDGNSEGGEEDPNVSRDDTQLADDTSQGDPDLVFTKKNRVRDNLAQLYTIISGDIEIISNSLTNVNDASLVNTMNIVLSHLRNCKTFTYTTLTKDLKSLEYDELLQRYITLKRIYDLCIEMMEKQFDKENKK